MVNKSSSYKKGKTGTSLKTGNIYVFKSNECASFEISIKTAAENPVRKVAVTFTLDNGKSYQSRTNDDGLAYFQELNIKAEGKLTFNDELDFYVKSIAADLFKAINDKDIDLIYNILDNERVGYISLENQFKGNYGTDLSTLLQTSFSEGVEASITQYLLLTNNLLSDDAVENNEDIDGQSKI